MMQPKVIRKVDDAERRLMMKRLREIHETDSGWVNVYEEFKGEIEYPLVIARRLEKNNLVESHRFRDAKLGEIFLFRITQHGLHSLANNRLNYKDLQKVITVPADVYSFLEDCAREAKITRKSSKGAGEKPSITGLLVKVASKPEQFRRWLKAVSEEGRR